MAGSVCIQGGSVLVALSTWLGRQGRTVAVYRTWLFGMIALGVLAMFVLSSMGGVGGKSGRSLWWLLVLLPYPIGWLLEMANLMPAESNVCASVTKRFETPTRAQAPEARHICRTGQTESSKLRQERHIPPLRGLGICCRRFYKDVAPDGAGVGARETADLLRYGAVKPEADGFSRDVDHATDAE